MNNELIFTLIMDTLIVITGVGIAALVVYLVAQGRR